MGEIHDCLKLMTKEKKINFSENDIRPKSLVDGQRKAFLADVASLIKNRNGFIKVPCPSCGSAEYVQKFEKYGFTYVGCKKCETLYTNPRPTPKILDDFYAHSKGYEYWNKYTFPASEKMRRNKIFVPRVNRILDICKKYGVNTNSILEVGNGFGTFCEELLTRKIFRRVAGVEPTPDLAKTCRKKGIEVFESLFEKTKFKKTDKFDIIANFEVIEHLFDPKEFIRKCNSLLKKGGLLVLTCPNSKGFDFEVLGKECNNIDHEHLNYFNPKSIKLLALNNGFEVLEISTPGRLDAELVRTKILEGFFDVSNQKFLQTVLIDSWDSLGEKFQDFLVENKLSSSMWMVAKKV
jgi:2-polyprenyl-3-methyl-5-hydroxy-6-metoxy-1,4-benzoquinol methylase